MNQLKFQHFEFSNYGIFNMEVGIFRLLKNQYQATLKNHYSSTSKYLGSHELCQTRVVSNKFSFHSRVRESKILP